MSYSLKLYFYFKIDNAIRKSNSIKNSNEKELECEEEEMKPRLHVKGLYYDNTCSI